jgi:hypothetical protein
MLEILNNSINNKLLAISKKLIDILTPIIIQNKKINDDTQL